jgi:hypothetical protein
LEACLDPPREVDQVVVGDGPEGLAASPTGGYAVLLLTNGSGGTVPNNAFFRHEHAVAVLLKTDGRTVRKLGETGVAPWPKASPSAPTVSPSMLPMVVNRS